MMVSISPEFLRDPLTVCIEASVAPNSNSWRMAEFDDSVSTTSVTTPDDDECSVLIAPAGVVLGPTRSAKMYHSGARFTLLRGAETCQREIMKRG